MDPQTPTPNITTTPAAPKRFNFKLPGPWKTACLVLLIALAVSVFMWKPWQTHIKASDRTISVTGNATVKAEPNEFIFNPSYDITNTDSKQAIADLTAKNNQVIDKLKSLGVDSAKIQSNASNYKDYFDPTTSTYTFSLTITVDDKALAQKVQDYLLTTDPSGEITPDYTFSDSKEKTLESQARDKAEQDARAKAEQSAKNLGFKVKAVKSVQDGSFESFGGCGPRGLCIGSDLQAGADSAKSQSLTLQPGQNDVPFSVS